MTGTRHLARLAAVLMFAGSIGCVSNPASDSPEMDPAVPAQTRAGTLHSGAESVYLAGYRASGNEPFWSLSFGEATMEFHSLGTEDTVSAPRPGPERVGGAWRFSATADGQPFVVQVEERRCNDTMSGRPFPHTVTVGVGGQSYTGCGGETARLLTGEEWRVTELEGTATTGSEPLTLVFDTDGDLNGNGGCNLYRSTYEITGEGLEIGPALATRRGCLEPAGNAQEVRFFSLLEQVDRFDIAADGRLQLIARDRPVIVARR